jgi:hypothetical protein
MLKLPHKRIIIMHGWGGTYADAATRIGDLLHFDCYWHNGSFMVPRRIAPMIRHLLNVPTPSSPIIALQMLAVSRFLAGGVAPSTVASADTYAAFSEARLKQDFGAFGIPLASEQRHKRATQLQQQAELALAPILNVIHTLQERWKDPNNNPQTERDTRDTIETCATEAGLTESLLPLLDMLRDMHETGGDLDTVASAALYAYSLVSEAQQANKPLHYGRDYAFAFLNYHESLKSLQHLAPATLYAADLPIGAFPNLEAEIVYLHDHNISIARYEDHHPYSPERRKLLDGLVADNILGYLSLSGPPEGEELTEEAAPRCGADMVYDSMVSGELWDSKGAQRLRVAAHGEDFVTNRTPFGILLTDLIKGGICKAELAQILVESMAKDDAMERLTERGWAALPQQWHESLNAVAESLVENVGRITLEANDTQIITALATHAPPGKPRMPTGKAIEFFARKFPDANYIFYCFGSSLMVARRLNHSDTALNLGALMPALGTKSDGGHAGAAVCRPDANPHYPTHLLGCVCATNFLRFSQYLADRLAAEGYPVASIEDISSRRQGQWKKGRNRAAIIIIAALALGSLLAWIFPAFRREHIIDSNLEFFPHIELNTTNTASRWKAS